MVGIYKDTGWDRQREKGGGWNANCCCLSPAAVRAVWHVWWMVLHCYRWPLTSTHCHQPRNKEEETQEWQKREIYNESSRCFLSSRPTHKCTRAFMQVLIAALFHQCKHTVSRGIKAHTHMHTLLHPDNLLQYVFAEQSIFPTAWLTTAFPFPPWFTPHWCNHYTTVQKHPGELRQTGTSLLTTYLLHILKTRHDEAVDECNLVNSWK